MSPPCPCAPTAPACLIQARQDVQDFLEGTPLPPALTTQDWIGQAAELSRRGLSELFATLRGQDAYRPFYSLQQRVGALLNDRPAGFEALESARIQDDAATAADLLRAHSVDAFDVDSLYRRALNNNQMDLARVFEPHADRAYPHQALLAYLNHADAPADLDTVERLAARMTLEDWRGQGTEILCAAVHRETPWLTGLPELARQIQAQHQSAGGIHDLKPLSSLLSDLLLDVDGAQRHAQGMVTWLVADVFTESQRDNVMMTYVQTLDHRRSDLLARWAPAPVQDRWLAQYTSQASTCFPWLQAKRQAEDRDAHAQTHGPSQASPRRHRA